jgi:hypothetical protein
MLTLQITKDQFFALIEQLSPTEKDEILQYLISKTYVQNSFEAVNGETVSHPQSLGHPINQLSGKIEAFQEVNALDWQQQVRSE